MSKLGLEGHVLFGGHSEELLLLMLRVSRLKLSSAVRARLRLGMYYVLVLTELQWICRTGAQGDGSLLNALSRKCYMCMLQYVHRGTLPCAENEKKAVFSFHPSPTIYNKCQTPTARPKQPRPGYPSPSI